MSLVDLDYQTDTSSGVYRLARVSEFTESFWLKFGMYVLMCFSIVALSHVVYDGPVNRPVIMITSTAINLCQGPLKLANYIRIRFT